MDILYQALGLLKDTVDRRYLYRTVPRRNRDIDSLISQSSPVLTYLRDDGVFHTYDR